MYPQFVALLEPHTLLFLWACAALFQLWRKRKAPPRRLWPLFIPLLALAVLSTPAAAHVALLTLEPYSGPLEQRPGDAAAIVVFSAGVHPPKGPRTRSELDEDSLDRCLLAARLYAQGPPCPVLTSGGKVFAETPGPAYAVVMADFLEELGVKRSDLTREESSRNTHENAVECARILKEQGIGRVVLVVDAVDMTRAAACLRHEGIDVVPAPCHFRTTGPPSSVEAFLPDATAAEQVERVWHEWLGLAWYRGRGWVWDAGGIFLPKRDLALAMRNRTSTIIEAA